MEIEKLDILKELFNRLDVTGIKQINERSVALSFDKDIVLYIDAVPSGLDFSLETRTHEAISFFEKIELDLSSNNEN